MDSPKSHSLKNNKPQIRITVHNDFFDALLPVPWGLKQRFASCIRLPGLSLTLGRKHPTWELTFLWLQPLPCFFTLRAVEALSLEGRMRQGKSYTAISRNHQSLGPPTTPCNCMAGCQASSSEAWEAKKKQVEGVLVIAVQRPKPRPKQKRRLQPKVRVSSYVGWTFDPMLSFCENWLAIPRGRMSFGWSQFTHKMVPW